MANVPGVRSRYNPRVLLLDNPKTVGEGRGNSDWHCVHQGICIDSGATEDVIGCEQCPIASNVTTLENEIPCDTVGGEVGIKNRGDLRVDGLEVDQGLMAPWSDPNILNSKA